MTETVTTTPLEEVTLPNEVEKDEPLLRLVKRPSISTTPSIACAGWLKKRSPNLLRTLQLRYCVLRQGKLFYYQKEGDLKEKGVIDFSTFHKTILKVYPPDSDKARDIEDVEVLAFVSNKSKYFDIVCMENEKKLRTFEFKVPKAHKYMFATWINRLFHEMNCNRLPVTLPQGEDLWRYELVASLDVPDVFTTGDIVLLTRKDQPLLRTPDGQRWFSHSDEVGILVRVEDHSLILVRIESKGGFKWDYWSKLEHENYSRILLRHLEISGSILLKDATLRYRQLETFIHGFQSHAKKDKKGYNFSLPELWGYKECLSHTDQEFSKPRFVAACLHNFGVLEEGAKDRNYFIDDFEKDTLPFKGGARLSPMIRVVFATHVNGQQR